jgi:TPR repeat protein
VVQDLLYRLGLDLARRGLHGAAFRIFLSLAEQSHCNGQWRLALAYEYGLGVGSSETMAAVWFRRAALGGHSEARYRLGCLYASGQGLMQDSMQARHWHGLALQGFCPLPA